MKKIYAISTILKNFLIGNKMTLLLIEPKTKNIKGKSLKKPENGL